MSLRDELRGLTDRTPNIPAKVKSDPMNTPSLSIYDRVEIDGTIFIRTDARKPGTGQALLAPVKRNDPDAGYFTRPRERDFEDRVRMNVARVEALALRQPLALSKPGSERQHLKAEVLRLMRIAGFTPKRVDPDHRKKVAKAAFAKIGNAHSGRGW